MLNNIPQQTLYGLMDLIYPVGSYYITESSDLNTEAAMNTKFGGTWERVTDVFLLGAGNSYALGATGGEASHKLTVNEMPSHTHTQNAHNHRVYSGTGKASNVAGVGYGYVYYLGGPDNGTGGDGWYTKTGGAGNPLLEDTVASNQNTGGSAAHNNMPPYRAVYMYRRTALSGGGA